MTKLYRPDIDGLRAIAIFLVLAFHAFSHQCSGGYVGVDVFFVISGFLISRILLNEIKSGTFSILKFYQRRIKRIFPALIFVMLCTSIYGWYYLLPNEFSALVKYISAGAGFVSNLLLWHESGYFDGDIALKPLMHLWSLSVEEQFYIFWPLLLAFAASRHKPRIHLVILFVASISFFYSLMQLNWDVTAAFYSPFARFWELLVGAYLAYLHNKPSKTITNINYYIPINTISIVGLLLILVAAFTLNNQSYFPGLWVVLPVAGTALIIYAGKDAWLNRHILSHKTLVWFGLISYPLYLWHWVILSFIRIQDPNPSWRVRCTAILLSIILAAITFYGIEKPLKKLQSKLVAPALSIAMLLILIISLATIKFTWFSKNLSPLQEKLLKTYNTELAYRYKTCFLDSKTQTESAFLPVCTPVKLANQATLLIWGDSLAAQLYPGLKQLILTQPSRFNLVQRTAGSCPPNLTSDHSENGNCDAINTATTLYIQAMHPEIVVINGRWLEATNGLEAHITAIVNFLKQNGVKKIVLVGPAPDWLPDLKSNLLRDPTFKNKLPYRLPPPQPAWNATQDLNARMIQVSQTLNVEYISLIEHFCNNASCLIRVSDQVPDGLITSDHDHFTQQASEYLFSLPKVKSLFLKGEGSE